MNETNNLMNSMDQIWTRIENLHQCVHINLHPTDQRKIRKGQFVHLVVKPTQTGWNKDRSAQIGATLVLDLNTVNPIIIAI